MKITDEDVINGSIEHIDIKDKTFVDCSNCSTLTSLPEWENVTMVNCSYCPGLTSLPQWEKVIRVYCYRCPGLISLPQWENAEWVDCSDCPGLTSLPEWENVARVDCYNCPGLTSLPSWEKVKNVYCFNCPGLASLPNWEKVTWVDCSDCSGLTSLPEWKNVKVVDCSDCSGLTSLPRWEKVIEVVCSRCLGLTILPEWPNIKWVVSDSVFRFNTETNKKTQGDCIVGGLENTEVIKCHNCGSSGARSRDALPAARGGVEVERKNVKECLEEARKLLERTIRVDRLYQETTKAVKKVNDQSMQGTPFASTGELDVEEEAYLLRRDKLKEFIEDVAQDFDTDVHKAELAVVWARQEHDTAVFRAMAYNCYKKEEE